MGDTSAFLDIVVVGRSPSFRRFSIWIVHVPSRGIHLDPFDRLPIWGSRCNDQMGTLLGGIARSSAEEAVTIRDNLIRALDPFFAYSNGDLSRGGTCFGGRYSCLLDGDEGFVAVMTLDN